MNMPLDQRFLGLSKGFQATAQHLDQQFLDPNIGGDPKAFGFFMSLTVLRVFAVELAIKALIAKTLNETPPFTHDLSKLFSTLPPAIEEKLETVFQIIRRMKPSFKGETDSLADILEAHHNAFVEWRYLDKGDIHVEVNVLNSVLETLWAVHSSYNDARN